MPLAEHNEDYHGCANDDEQENEPQGRGEEHAVRLQHHGWTLHDGADVFVLFIFELAHFRCCSRSFLDVEGETLGANGAVLLGLGVVEHELGGRNFVLSNLLRHSQEVVNHVSLYAVGGQLGLVCYLYVVLVETLGEVYRRCF